MGPLARSRRHDPPPMSQTGQLSRRKILAAGALAMSNSVALALADPSSDKPAPTSASKRKLIFTVGHPGDPRYGCGGTIARLADLGHDVILLYLNRGAPNESPGQTDFPRVAEAASACKIL